MDITLVHRGMQGIRFRGKECLNAGVRFRGFSKLIFNIKNVRNAGGV